MKEGAVEIRRRAGRPVAGRAARLVERCQAAGRGGAIEERSKVPGVQASFVRARALFESRQPFDLPRGREEVRHRHRMTAEHAAQPRKPSARAIEMKDVRVLVNEHEAQPVAGVADRAVAARRRREDLDDVEGKWRRPSIRKVVLGDEDHVDAPVRPPEGRLEVGRGLFGDRGEPPRERFLCLVKVDVERRR